MRKNVALLFVLALMSASSLVQPFTVNAAPRTIVVPDDYPTVPAAIDRAVDGDTVLVKKGVYEGSQNRTLFIDKSISIIGEASENTVIRLHPPLVPMRIITFEYMGYLDAITINSSWVKLSGLTITSDGGDLSASGNGTQIIDNNLSFKVLATGDGTRIVGNSLKGIALTGSNQTIAQNSVINGTSEFLISVKGSFNTITSNKVAGSGGGIYTNGSHNIIYGNSIATQDGINAGLEVNGNENIVYKNNISNYVCIGSTFVPESSSNAICGNTISNNLAIVGNNNVFNGNYLQGIVLGNRIQDASNNTFYHNNFDFAKKEVWYSGEKTFTVWEGVRGAVFLDNGKEGNYYSDYNGSDLNSDGIGDTPYVIVTKDPNNFHNIADFNIADMVLTDHYPLMTPFDVSSVTMELPQWEFTSAAATLYIEGFFPLEPVTTQPSIVVESPEQNRGYDSGDVWLNFTITKPETWFVHDVAYTEDNESMTLAIGRLTRVYYVLDNGEPQNIEVEDGGLPYNFSIDVFPTPVFNFSVRLALPGGVHSVKVGFEADTYYYSGWGVSDPVLRSVEVDGLSDQVAFTVSEASKTILIVIAAVTAVIMFVGLLLYFKKRRHQKTC